MPFWQAFDDAALGAWGRLLPAKGLVLDLACGDGRCALPLAAGRTVIACDISREQIQNAIARAGDSDCLFFVGDALDPPVVSGAFDAATFYGGLHHLPDPEAAFRNGLDRLQTHGVLLASEPNLTVLRPLFDALMGLLPAWHEEANDDLLISDEMVQAWSRNCGASAETYTTVFVPPHLCNWLGPRLGRTMLRTTDRIGRATPFVRGNGGIIMIAAR